MKPDHLPLFSLGNPDRLLSELEIRSLVAQALDSWDLTRQRVLLIVPDGTRTAPVGQLFRLLHELLWGRVKALDVLVALGTHPPMSTVALNHLLGISAEERAEEYAGVHIFNHTWDQVESLVTLGSISAEETEALSQGALSLEVPVRLNRLALEYDVLLVCGPVFPHEIVGYSGGSKYFFPGISGPEVIHFTHWLGALITSYAIIGRKHNPVRESVERAAAMIPRPKLSLCMVACHDGLYGLYAGEVAAAWSAAADLSARVHVRYFERPFQKVLSLVGRRYDDLWTGGKGMYKIEPVVADGGEVVLYAPHINEVSYTHGQILDQIGYHVRDYFAKQWERFKDYPWGVLAHATDVRGIGSYEAGIERPRVRVILAMGIPPERCRLINLDYLDPALVRPEDWQGREAEGVLVVPDAGEILYRLHSQRE